MCEGACFPSSADLTLMARKARAMRKSMNFKPGIWKIVEDGSDRDRKYS